MLIYSTFNLLGGDSISGTTGVLLHPRELALKGLLTGIGSPLKCLARTRCRHSLAKESLRSRSELRLWFALSLLIYLFVFSFLR